ncbi:MAG: hypothetical protein E6Q90_00040 [Actinobacteria bacterium]|nr:MAG: hypothetical protein E6Q90_00040 [Actinomycetota bacterium]
MSRRLDGHGTAHGSRVSPISKRFARHGTRRAAIMLTAGLLVANAAAAGGLVWAKGLPGQFVSTRPEQKAPPQIVTGSGTPAAQTVFAVAATEVAGFSAAPAANVGSGRATAYPCELNPPTQPVVGSFRVYTAGDRAVSTTTSVYPTGAGAWVMQQLAAQLSDCGDRRAEVGSPAGVDSLGVESVTATVPAGSVTLVRRGDVVMQLIGPSADVATVATGLDATLAANLASCVNPASGVADAQRNPWLQGVTYVGLLADSEVRVPKQGPPAGTTAAPKVAIDAQPIAVTEVALPQRPSDPVWPLSLPAAVNLPTAPSSPGPEPESTVVQVPMVDKLGPGCGWAFTSASAPVVNEAAVAAERDRLREAARVNLVAQQQAWRPRVQAYYQQWADYKKSVGDYQKYSLAVSVVASSWNLINSQRMVYAQQLQAYQDAVAAKDNFYAAQAQASRDYLNAVALCAIPVPDPTPTPTPTSSYVPEPSYTSQPSYGPQPTESSQPTGAPGPTASATTQPTVPATPSSQPSSSPSTLGQQGSSSSSTAGGTAANGAVIIGGMGVRGMARTVAAPALPAAPRPGCPAPRPAILDQAPPYVPPAPTPPPDPRPAQYRN